MVSVVTKEVYSRHFMNIGSVAILFPKVLTPNSTKIDAVNPK